MNKYILLDVDQYLAVLSLLIPYKWRWVIAPPITVLFIIFCHRIFRE